MGYCHKNIIYFKCSGIYICYFCLLLAYKTFTMVNLTVRQLLYMQR